MERNKRGWSWPGNWRVVCDVCGIQEASGKVKKRWDGLMVCEKDWETRHPQTLYRYKAHTSVPDFIRDEPAEDTFLGTCDIVSVSGYAGLAAAGCAQAANTTYSYEFLYGLRTNGHE